MSQGFDVIVIGGGHAGCEAASAAARLGARTALVTHSFATIGEMSCNPAIGGLGKGHLVREIDALDGLMGRVADQAGIQFRVLNRSKGPAVQGPRAQADRKLYRQAMQAAIQATPGLEVIEAAVEDLIVDLGRVTGIVTARWAPPLRRRRGADHRHLPQRADPYRRDQDPGRPHERGPCPRSVDPALWARACAWAGSRPAPRPASTAAPFAGTDSRSSPATTRPGRSRSSPTRSTTPQVACHITHTTDATHAIIARNLDRAPMYSGAIESVGPRYCPSIEDKVVRFKERHSHQIFLEPEGLDDHTVYPNGISTSLPEDVQHAFLKTIPGLEHGARHQTRLRHRIRLCRSARADRRPRDQGASPACSWPARSTARPVTRKPPGRGSSPASTPRFALAAGQGASPYPAPTAISA